MAKTFTKLTRPEMRKLAPGGKINDRLMPLHTGLFCETNPTPAKYAVSVLGKCAPDVRLPLVALSDAGRETVRRAMAAVGLIG